jgi:acetyltransferase
VTEATGIIAEATQAGRAALSEIGARAVLSACGLPFTEHREVTTPEEATRAAREIGAPVALKLVSATILHKSDAGGVRLGVLPERAAEAFEDIERSVGSWVGTHGLEAEPVRVMISPMLRAPRLELLVGGTRDPDLGPVLTVGAGGVWVEALADVAHHVLPARDEEVIEAIRSLRVAPTLEAGRGLPAVHLEPVVRVAQAVARVLARHPEVVEVELNPVFVYDGTAEAVDARIVLGS